MRELLPGISLGVVRSLAVLQLDLSPRSGARPFEGGGTVTPRLRRRRGSWRNSHDILLEDGGS